MAHKIVVDIIWQRILLGGLLLCCAGLALAQQSQPVSIPISSTWHFGPSSGMDGTVLYAGYGGSFSQDLGVSPQQIQAILGRTGYYYEGVYVLKFSAANYFPSYPGKYDVEVTFGTQQLCEAYKWGTKAWVQIALVCPSPGYLVADQSLPSGGPAQGNQNFVLHFTVNDGSPNGGWPVLFDKVSLTFQPEQP